MNKLVIALVALALLGAGGWVLVARQYGVRDRGASPGLQTNVSVLPRAKALLFAKKKDTVIGTIDVQPDGELLKQLSTAQRKDVLLATALELTLAEVRTNTRLAGTDKMRIHVIRILNHDDYGKGDLHSMVELGTIETSTALAANVHVAPTSRILSVAWKPGLDQ